MCASVTLEKRPNIWHSTSTPLLFMPPRLGIAKPQFITHKILDFSRVVVVVFVCVCIFAATATITWIADEMKLFMPLIWFSLLMVAIKFYLHHHIYKQVAGTECQNDKNSECFISESNRDWRVAGLCAIAFDVCCPHSLSIVAVIS